MKPQSARYLDPLTTPELSYNNLMEDNMRVIVHYALSYSLTPRQERILRMIYGIGYERMTIKEIATAHNVGEARILRIKTAAIRTLRLRLMRLPVSDLIP